MYKQCSCLYRYSAYIFNIGAYSDPYTSIGATLLSWNSHRIQGCGGGIPLVPASARNFTFSLRHIPTVQEAVNMYLGEGSNLIPENGIGCDPLQDYPQLKVSRERDFFERFNMELVFQNILHSNGNLRTCIF